MTDLNAGWYNVVAQALDLDPTTFQLAQGTLGLQTSDSSGLFLIGDAVPPSASVAHFDSAGLSRRSSAFQQLLGALLPETGSDLAVFLKDQYAGWITYRTAFWKDNPTSTLTQEQLFAQWANRTLDPRTAKQAITTYALAANSQLYQALDALTATAGRQSFVSSAGTTYTLPIYSATSAGATAAINGGASATIAFDSSTMNTTLSHTTAQGSASGFYDIFSAGAGTSFDQLNTTAAGSEWTIEGTIGKYATLASEPGSWFTSGELTRAYNAKNDFTVWDQNANAGTWDSFFAQPAGALARRVSQLVLVSDYSITVTSHATYSQSDAETISAHASFGIWPFFSAEASGTQTTQVTLNSDSTLKVTHTLPKGLIQIWGVTVQDAPN
ncbi:hypothetical protein [Cellulomonas sp. P5_C5]